ncbi:hypothetical protein GOC13_07110 [Sinorhizobium meliloti]|nr:hypothetical protein [Sinorhizobium meliloti]
MIDKITAFIDKYLVMGLGVLLAAAVAFGAWQTWALSDAKQDLKDAQMQIEQLKDQVAAKKAELALKNVTITVLENRNSERLAEQLTYNFDLQGILNAPAEENQNLVDDVICRAVSGSKCLRNN